MLNDTGVNGRARKTAANTLGKTAERALWLRRSEEEVVIVHQYLHLSIPLRGRTICWCIVETQRVVSTFSSDPDSKTIWAPCMMYTGLPLWARPYRTHIGPIRTSPYEHAYNGPMWDPDSNPMWAQCGMYRGLSIWVPYRHAHMGWP